jgi:hypothetical protein
LTGAVAMVSGVVVSDKLAPIYLYLCGFYKGDRVEYFYVNCFSKKCL